MMLKSKTNNYRISNRQFVYTTHRTNCANKNYHIDFGWVFIIKIDFEENRQF